MLAKFPDRVTDQTLQAPDCAVRPLPVALRKRAGTVSEHSVAWRGAPGPRAWVAVTFRPCLPMTWPGSSPRGAQGSAVLCRDRGGSCRQVHRFMRSQPARSPRPPGPIADVPERSLADGNVPDSRGPLRPSPARRDRRTRTRSARTPPAPFRRAERAEDLRIGHRVRRARSHPRHQAGGFGAQPGRAGLGADPVTAEHAGWLTGRTAATAHLPGGLRAGARAGRTPAATRLSVFTTVVDHGVWQRPLRWPPVTSQRSVEWPCRPRPARRG
jgi:hypothetical protein